MADMIKLFVNGEEVEVASGRNLIDAVRAVGIEIPHLCYHPALGADGNCRLCLVEIEEGRPPIVPACKTLAQEGMRMRLDSEKIKKIQRDILELELINHPTDCPVCDQAGECALQDLYMNYDCAASRMRVDKVAKEKKLDFGCGVIHDQERCVLCARCVRFTRKITRTGELGIVNRTDVARVAIFPGRPLNNRYAGNVVDLCPVGAMTSADFRFRQRAWFLQKDQGICHGCARGCSIYIDHNREKGKDDIIYRYRPRHNDLVNGYFICDDGRMSYKTENEARQQHTLLQGEITTLEKGVEKAKGEIAQADRLVFSLSPDLSLEQYMAVLEFADRLGGSVCVAADHFVQEGDGDDLLISEDKAVNRKGFELLGIVYTDSAVTEMERDADLIIRIVAHPLDLKRKSAASGQKTILLTTHSTSDKAELVLPLASYSEYAGTVINCDGLVQQFAKAVIKNNPVPDVMEMMFLLGGRVNDISRARTLLSERVAAFKEIDFNAIPADGMKLPEKERI